MGLAAGFLVLASGLILLIVQAIIADIPDTAVTLAVAFPVITGYNGKRFRKKDGE